VNQLNIKLFGKFSIEFEKQVLRGFDSRKVQELFFYLLMYRDRPHSRETLASLLWKENSTSQSKKYLRQALWQLQNALQKQAQSNEQSLLLIEAEWIQINPQAHISLDVESFEKAYEAARGLRGRELNAPQLHALERAARLYEADLLSGWYQDWCLYERERLENMCLAILDKLMAYCEAHGNYEAGLIYGTRILNFDCARERTHRRIMRLYYLSGDRTAALRQYTRCAEALDEELSVKPAKLTEELYAIVSEDLPISSYREKSIFVAGKRETRVHLPKVMVHLKQLQGILDDVQKHVKKDIETIENTLKSQS